MSGSWRRKKDPELLAKINMLQQQLQTLVQEFKDGEGEFEAPPPVREPLDAALIDRVRTMTQERPLFFAEIVATTGEKENTIKAVLTRMQRDDELIINIGQANKALWYYFAPKVAARVLERLSELGVRGSGAQRERA